MRDEGKLPKVLCVDDEPQVLQGLGLHLRRRYKYFSATSGAEGLDILGDNPDMAVVVSDMRMPGMDGAAFLAAVREKCPDTVRMLLTGQADMESAISAVNRGQIFRFLTKPCPAKDLLAAVDAAVEQHRLVTAERELLEKTLRGSVQTLVDLLGLVAPAAAGRAVRLRRGVEALATAAGPEPDWALPIAAMLSQLGAVTLPAETQERYLGGGELSVEETEMVSRLPGVVDRLLSNIPRLEPVRETIRWMGVRFDGAQSPAGAPSGERIPVGSRILKVVHDYDLLESQGLEPSAAIDILRHRQGAYDQKLVDLLSQIVGGGAAAGGVREVPLEQVKQGMVFAQDVRSQGGLLLIARGSEVSASMLERIKNLPEQLRKQLVRVTVAG
ncbi:MAG: response regulator [Deltaproteobacteria bacterium]|nr:MAG: response regulator [Deltaproteobacteria bacterium]